jgi:hypothetical protein
MFRSSQQDYDDMVAGLDASIDANGGNTAIVNTTAYRLAAMDLRELAMHQFKQRDPLLAPWLCSQDLAMIFAGRGIGKTHFTWGIGYAIATGGPFGPWKAPEPKKVLLLDGEMPGAVCQQRAAMHMPDVEPEPGYFRVFTPAAPRTTSPSKALYSLWSSQRPETCQVRMPTVWSSSWVATTTALYGSGVQRRPAPSTGWWHWQKKVCLRQKLPLSST